MICDPYNHTVRLKHWGRTIESLRRKGSAFSQAAEFSDVIADYRTPYRGGADFILKNPVHVHAVPFSFHRRISQPSCEPKGDVVLLRRFEIMCL